MRKTFYWLLFYSFFAPMILCCSELPFYSALKTNTAPNVDGVLDEDCWKNAYKTEPFVAIGGKSVSVKTTGMLCWDDKTLYVAYICEEPMMKVLEKNISTGKIEGFEESVEIFIDTNYDRSSYIQLRIGLTGERDSRKGNSFAPEIQEGWSVSIKKYADNWTMEAAIPFAVLGEEYPSPDIIWGINLNRQRLVGPQDEKWTCWSDTKGAFATPQRFGNLIFADYPLWIRCRYTSLTRTLTEETTNLMMHYPMAGKPLFSHLSHLDSLWSDFLGEVSDLSAERAGGYVEIISKGESIVISYKELLARLRMEVIKTEFR